jgi:hypothetical protein
VVFARVAPRGGARGSPAAVLSALAQGAAQPRDPPLAYLHHQDPQRALRRQVRRGLLHVPPPGGVALFRLRTYQEIQPEGGWALLNEAAAAAEALGKSPAELLGMLRPSVPLRARGTQHWRQLRYPAPNGADWDGFGQLDGAQLRRALTGERQRQAARNARPPLVLSPLPNRRRPGPKKAPLFGRRKKPKPVPVKWQPPYTKQRRGDDEAAAAAGPGGAAPAPLRAVASEPDLLVLEPGQGAAWAARPGELAFDRLPDRPRRRHALATPRSARSDVGAAPFCAPATPPLTGLLPGASRPAPPSQAGPPALASPAPLPLPASAGLLLALPGPDAAPGTSPAPSRPPRADGHERQRQQRHEPGQPEQQRGGPRRGRRAPGLGRCFRIRLAVLRIRGGERRRRRVGGAGRPVCRRCDGGAPPGDGRR